MPVTFITDVANPTVGSTVVDVPVLTTQLAFLLDKKPVVVAVHVCSFG
jgi:hypothetical protein